MMQLNSRYVRESTYKSNASELFLASPLGSEEEFFMEPGSSGRHRGEDGELSRKHGNTLVGTLRKIYGPSFAAEQSETAKLSQVLADLDEPSLSQLARDHGDGRLEDKVRKAALD
jgi:hypothetical protein